MITELCRARRSDRRDLRTSFSKYALQASLLRIAFSQQQTLRGFRTDDFGSVNFPWFKSNVSGVLSAGHKSVVIFHF